MTISRRQFVQRGAGVALGSAIAAPYAWGEVSHTALGGLQPGHIPQYRDPAEQAALLDRAAMRALASKAVDAARQAGATYADARLTRIVSQSYVYQSQAANDASVDDSETLGVGVRALFNGYWGFSASPYWDADEVVRLGRDAVAQAKVNASVGKRPMDLGPSPASTGDWTMPGIDPFTIPIEEKNDLMNSWRQAVNDTVRPGFNIGLGMASMEFARHERILVSSDGTSTAQTLYLTSGGFGISVNLAGTNNSVGVGAQGLDLAGKGWELITDAKIRDQIPLMLDRADVFLHMPVKGVEIGRYDVVMDATSAASLTSSTIGLGTQLDRALGYEANSGGTSYLGPDPLALLGTFQVASPLVTVTGERTTPGAPATVKWDDDGVAPEPFTLVKDGILVDYQTTRDQAAWLAPWYQKQGMPVRSHGCAFAQSAQRIQTQFPPNLVLKPGNTTTSFDDMVASTKRGLAIISGGVGVDFQGRSGLGAGLIREITNGKLGPVMANAGFLFNTVDLWKNVTAIGGTGSSADIVATNFKGQPFQLGSCRVTGVPLAIHNVNIVDRARRA